MWLFKGSKDNPHFFGRGGGPIHQEQGGSEGGGVLGGFHCLTDGSGGCGEYVIFIGQSMILLEFLPSLAQIRPRLYVTRLSLSIS